MGLEPTHMPGEQPPAPAPEEPSRITYLRDNRSGRVYAWSEILAEREDMVALDQYHRIVPNAPFSTTAVDPDADPSPAIDGVPRMSDIKPIHQRMSAMQAEIAALRDQITRMG